MEKMWSWAMLVMDDLLLLLVVVSAMVLFFVVVVVAVGCFCCVEEIHVKPGIFCISFMMMVMGMVKDRRWCGEWEKNGQFGHCTQEDEMINAGERWGWARGTVGRFAWILFSLCVRYHLW